MSKALNPRTAASKAGMAQAPMDALQLLKTDHDRVKELFKDYADIQESGSDEDKLALVEKICLELRVHTQIEEEIFYPSAREFIEDDSLLDEAEVEHHSAKQLISELESMQPGDPKYDATVTVLQEYIEHHVKEEEEELFPQIAKTELDMKELGEEMTDLQMELLDSLSGDYKNAQKAPKH